MSRYTAGFGGILFERIGAIRVLVDGELQHEFDLALELRDIEFNDAFGYSPREERPGIFQRWKRFAYKGRVTLGLPVLPPGDSRPKPQRLSSDAGTMDEGLDYSQHQMGAAHSNRGQSDCKSQHANRETGRKHNIFTSWYRALRIRHRAFNSLK